MRHGRRRGTAQTVDIVRCWATIDGAVGAIAVERKVTKLQEGPCAREATQAHMVSGSGSTSIIVRAGRCRMMIVGRGVAAKCTGGGHHVRGHGAAVADALRERGHQPCLDLHSARRPGASAARLAEHLLLERDERLRCELDSYSAERSVAVTVHAAQPQLLARGRGMFRKTNLARFVIFNQIWPTWGWTQSR